MIRLFSMSRGRSAPRRQSLRGRGLLGLALAALLVSAQAAQTILWDVDDRGDFEAGEAHGVRITDPGSVSLARAIETPKDAAKTLADPLVWSLARDAKGNLYLGTGNEGRIYRWSRDGQLQLLADLDAAEIYALAVDKDGRLFAGASPSGIVYQIDEKGRTSIYHKTGATYIWAMAFDAEGRLVLSTGKPAQVLRLSGPDKAESLLASGETHLLSLLIGSKGSLYAGSVGEGLVYEIPPQGKPRVLWDSPESEIRGLAEGPDGALFIAGTPEVKLAPRVPGQPPTQGEPKLNKTSHVFRLSPDGDLALWWQSPNALIFAMVGDGAGGVVVATDKEGSLYHVMRAGESEALVRAPGEMALCLVAADNGELWAGTGNPAQAVHVRNELADQGELISDVKDFGADSRFGRIQWESRGPGDLTLATRSGNVAKPDPTWSDWSEGRKSPGDVSSPAGRFLQWKAQFKRGGKDQAPILDQVSVAARQLNRAPQIVQFGLRGVPPQPAPQPGPGPSAPGGAAAPGPGVSAPGSRPTAPSGDSGGDNGPIAVAWQALDPNGDSLVAKLEFRGQGEERWLLLKDEISGSNYRWDTDSIPDGRYELRLTVSDAPANPSSEVKSATEVSDTILVDNTPPRVAAGHELNVDKSGKGWAATVTLVDEASPLGDAQYSVDAGDWRPVVPEDGIFDEQEETLRFPVEAKSLEPGAHTLVVRFRDSEGNTGATKRSFRIEK